MRRHTKRIILWPHGLVKCADIRLGRVDKREHEDAAERTCVVTLTKQAFCVELKALRASDTSGLVVSEETSVVCFEDSRG